jgi:hypothetical protein
VGSARREEGPIRAEGHTSADVGAAGSSGIVEHTGESMVNVEIREKGEGFDEGDKTIEETTHIFSPVVVSYISVYSRHAAARYLPLGENRVKWALEEGLVTTRRMREESRSSHRSQADQSGAKCSSATMTHRGSSIIILEYMCIDQIDVDSALRDRLVECRYPS